MSNAHPTVHEIPLEAAPEVVVDLPTSTGEGTLWDDREQVLYWLDIPPGRVYRYNPATNGNDLVFQHDAAIGGTTLQEDGSLLLFCSFGTILRLDATTGKSTVIVASIEAERDTRFNDVEADPEGGVFCGTMPSKGHEARLYRLARDGSLTMLYDDIGLSNGIGFSPDMRTMYHVDTNKCLLHSFSYDKTTGNLTDRNILISKWSGEGYPDGMTVDSEGYLWVARWDGKAVYRYTPDGEAAGRVRFPVRKVSDIAFGGPGFADAYVSTA
ncbi:MAG: SMP-30/gluconolactonase/LRE family protein, partial [Thermomicrobiales bacterium]